MRVTRLYVPETLAVGNEYLLPEAASRHVVRVLRLQPGAALAVFDGTGGEYDAVLIRSDRNQAWVRIEAFQEREAESPLQITLVQGISRGERMDYAIQKAVELGVNEIVPVFTERSTVTLKGERADKRLSHWEAVARSACEQCGRNRIPALHPPIRMGRWLASWDTHGRYGLLLSPTAERCLGAVAPPVRPVTVLIGPEGGLSDGEQELATRQGFEAVRLGPRILRTETAAVAVLAAMQTLWGDFGPAESASTGSTVDD